MTKDSNNPTWHRCAIVVLLGTIFAALPLACSKDQGAKEVPVSKRGPSESLIDPKAATRPPAGIATH